jgi:hypothetical protein
VDRFGVGGGVDFRRIGSDCDVSIHKKKL